MTIALGILASDGVVVAADAQETSGYFKSFALKVHSAMTHSSIHSNVKSAVVISGAGPGVYLDAVADEIIQQFHGHQGAKIEDLELLLKEFVAEFYSAHVTPLQPHIDRQFELIVGAQVEGRRGLWVTEGNVVKPSRGFEAVGSGHPFARMAIQTRAGHTNVQCAALLGILGVMQARKYDSDCGQGTMVTFIKDNRTYTVPWHQIETAEKLFKKYAGIDYSAFAHALGSELTEDPGRLQHLSQSLTTLRAEFAQLATNLIGRPD